MKNKIHYKEKTVKFLDSLIDDIEDIEYFSIQDFINKHGKLSPHEKQTLPYTIGQLGITYGLFENTLESKNWFKLTRRGIALKEYGKGFNKFENKENNKLSIYEKISILLFFITFSYGIYQHCENKSLENRVEILENQILLKSDSL